MTEKSLRRVALVAHDGAKDAMVAWAKRWRDALATKSLVATGTTGGRLALEAGLDVHCFKSGPLGGDAQLGAEITEGRLSALIFFTDPLSAQPHDVDVKALLRLATLHEVVIAMNTATADLLISSPRFAEL